MIIGTHALFGLGRRPLASQVLLFVIAVPHNIPEGLAVGVLAGARLAGADSVALGIALRDLPEG